MLFESWRAGPRAKFVAARLTDQHAIPLMGIVRPLRSNFRSAHAKHGLADLPAIGRNGPASSLATAFLTLNLCLACGPAPYQAVEVANPCSLHLDGDDDFVDLGTIAAGSPLMLAGSPFTVSAWFRQEPGGDPYQRILDKSDGAVGRNGYALGADPGEKRIHFYVHGGNKGGDFISVAGAYQLGHWHHVAGVARQGRLEIWVDGRRDGRASYESGAHALPADFATTARLGTWNHEPGREFKGWLDEVAIWNRDLSGDAIQAIYSARGHGDLSRDWGPYDYSAALVGWWRMEPGAQGASDLSLADASGKNNSGRLMPDPASGNAPTFDCKSVP